MTNKECSEYFNKLKEIYLLFLCSPYTIPDKQHSLLLEQIFMLSNEKANRDDLRTVRAIMEVYADKFFRGFYHEAWVSEENFSRATLCKYYGDIDFIIDYLIKRPDEQS